MVVLVVETVKERDHLIPDVREMIVGSVIMTVVTVIVVVLEIVIVTIAIETEIEITGKEIEEEIEVEIEEIEQEVPKKKKKIQSLMIAEIEIVTVIEDIVEIVTKMGDTMIEGIIIIVIEIEDVEMIEREEMIFKAEEEVECVVEDLIERNPKQKVDLVKFLGAEFLHEEEEGLDFPHMDNIRLHMYSLYT